MKVPNKLRSVCIWVHTDLQGAEKINPVFSGLKHVVNQEFYKHGYDVSDTFSIGSDNGYRGHFCIIISPQKENGDSLIYIIDEELADQNERPTIEALTEKMIKAIRDRNGLHHALVERNGLPGIDFLENYIVKDDMYNYVLK